MRPWIKIAIGLAASLCVGVVSYWPLGQGDAFIDGLEAQARDVVHQQIPPDINGSAQRDPIAHVTLRMQRDPLARTAILSGPTNRFQREGLQSQPGLDGLVTAVPGIARVVWTNPPTGD